MNIEIVYDRDNNICDILVKQKYGTTISNDSKLKTLFEVGYTFQLYCKKCWESQEMYNEENNDDQSVEPDEDDLDYNEEDEDDDDYNYNVNNMYYVGKGKDDLY
jgi:hypothetical protein